MTKPKIIFFDIGNVFMTYDKIFTRVCRELNLDKAIFDKIYEPYDVDANLGKISIPDVWKKICPKLNIPDQNNYKIVEAWVSDYESIAPTHNLLEQIKDKYQLGIISNYYLDYFQEATRQGFVPNINFSPIIISAEVGVAKPDPTIYQIAQDKSGFSGPDILFVDDKSENLVTPRQLGWQTFLFDYKNPQKSVEELSCILL